MRLIKLAFISIIILFTVVTIISLLIPSNIRISKAINIHGNKDSILSLIRTRDRWTQWHPAFIQNDSTPSFEHISSVVRIQNDSEIVMQLQQGTKPPVTNGWKIYGHRGIDSLTLQWYMDFHLKWYPWKKFGSLFYENTYGVMMEKGLENIRQLTVQ